MATRSTIYEVAQRSGVSTATVSRVMRNGTGFSEATRARVLRAAAELGWIPSSAARGLANRRAGIIGVLFPDLGGDLDSEAPLYIDQLIRGAEIAATAAGDAVLIAATRGGSRRELAMSVASKVDGLVIVARSLDNADVAALGRRLPTVVISDKAGRIADVDSVSVDNVGGMRALVAHLVQRHRHRDLVYVAGPPGSPDSEERFSGFCAALIDADLTAPDAPQVVGHFTETGGAAAVGALLAGGHVPDAVVCGNDEMALGALGALNRHGLRAPRDLAVTGFDDLAFTRHVRPPLTTVAQPMRDIGVEAVRTVLTRLDDPSTPRRATVLPTSLVVRRSCGCRPARSAGLTTGARSQARSAA